MADLPAPILPDLVQRYLNGESLQTLAAESHHCVRTLYHWLLAECGEQYDQVITQGLINRIADADLQLELARDNIQIARAREMAKFARMDFERRRPKLYGPKQEITEDKTIRVIIAPAEPVTPYIDPSSPIITVNSQVIDNTQDNEERK